MPESASDAVSLWARDDRGWVRYGDVAPEVTFPFRGLPPTRCRLDGYAFRREVRYEVVPGVEAASGVTGVVVRFAAC